MGDFADYAACGSRVGLDESDEWVGLGCSSHGVLAGDLTHAATIGINRFAVGHVERGDSGGRFVSAVAKRPTASASDGR